MSLPERNRGNWGKSRITDSRPSITLHLGFLYVLSNGFGGIVKAGAPRMLNDCSAGTCSETRSHNFRSRPHFTGARRPTPDWNLL